MSLDTRVREGFIRLSGLIKQRGVKSGGTTGQILAKISANDYETQWINLPEPADAGASIDDATTSGSKTWSSSKTSSEIATSAANVKSDILGGAGPTVDTLKEIADQISASDLNDDNALAALTIAVGNRVRFDEAQSLTDSQKTQALANIGAVSLAAVGPTDTDYVALINTELGV